MIDAMMQLEPWIRLGVFGGVLAVMVVWEFASPRRRDDIPRLLRWSGNLGIVAIDTIIVRLLFPAAAVGVALLARDGGWGLFNLFPVPGWLAILAAVVMLDFVIYLQHVLFHAVPGLWRLHRMHHADLAFDTTTGLRFHPIEIILSMALKMAMVAALGAPPVSVLIFEVLLNATSLFNHGNVSLPPRLDRLLRWVVVTPDMHRVHHSWHPDETNSNFGFNLPWWDRLLGTYQPQPRDGHDRMTIGINLFRDPKWERLDRMLIQPFVGPVHSYPINRRERRRTEDDGD